MPLKRIGSQTREPRAEAGYLVIHAAGGEAILEDRASSRRELWALRDDFTGYVVEIQGKGYEFVRSL